MDVDAPTQAGGGGADGDATTQDKTLQPNGYNGTFGFGPTNGGFQNMAFGDAGNFNQMQMMMAMNNGMAPNSFGAFPMMGPYFPSLHAFPGLLLTTN